MNEETPSPQVANPRTENRTTLSLYLRRLFFGVCIILFLFVILYLVYSNGKSIYDNGI